MSKYTAILTRDVIEKVTMESFNLYGEKLHGSDYSIDCPMKAGKRTFKTMKARNAWIERLNGKFGLNTAIIA